jgi:prefoldin subunit 5
VGEMDYRQGPTLSDERNPAKRLQKLCERRQHIEDQIAELKDKHFIIESEISELNQK